MRDSFSEHLLSPAPNHLVTEGRFTVVVTEAFYSICPGWGCHAGTGTSQRTAMLQLGMPSSTLTLTEPAHPTRHCRTFIFLGLFCGFEGFSVTEGHKRSTHTLMPGHTQLYTQSCKAHMRAHIHTCVHAHIHVHTQSCTGAHACIHSYIHSCTTATHIITHEVLHRHMHM